MGTFSYEAPGSRVFISLPRPVFGKHLTGQVGTIQSCRSLSMESIVAKYISTGPYLATAVETSSSWISPSIFPFGWPARCATAARGLHWTSLKRGSDSLSKMAGCDADAFSCGPVTSNGGRKPRLRQAWTQFEGMFDDYNRKGSRR